MVNAHHLPSAGQLHAARRTRPRLAGLGLGKGVGMGLAALMLLLVGGCASTPSGPARLVYAMDGVPPGQVLVWPAPPEPARYAWAGSLEGEANLVAPPAAGGALARLGRWIAGLDEPAPPLTLQRPAAVAVDGAGRVYVSDVGRQAVLVFDPPAGRLQVWDQAQGLLRLHSPSGLAPAPGGGIYVADAQLGAVYLLGPSGQPRAEIGRGQLQRPTGLARDPASGRLYVADTAAHDLKVFDAQGRLLGRLGRRGSGPAEFNAPSHLAWAGGELYVTDTFNHRVQVLGGTALADPAAGRLEMRRSIGRQGLRLGELVRPKGVAVDADGRVVVVESYYDSLLVYDQAGDFLLPLGSGVGAAGLRAQAAPSAAPATPATPAAAAGAASSAATATSSSPADLSGAAPLAELLRFYLPAGLWADGQGQLWVADQFRGRVVRLRYVGPDAAIPRPLAHDRSTP
jgi:DNA-binding beta-propeller fold protein YncE